MVIKIFYGSSYTVHKTWISIASHIHIEEWSHFAKTVLKITSSIHYQVSRHDVQPFSEAWIRPLALRGIGVFLQISHPSLVGSKAKKRRNKDLVNFFFSISSSDGDPLQVLLKA
jgi:cell division protein FtsW (lipid II flippase)